MSRFSENMMGQRGRSMGRDGLEIALSGLSGLAIGAALMYLFDPKSGSNRRERIGETAQSASRMAKTAGSAVSSAAHQTREYAGDLKDRIVGSRRRKQYAKRFRSALRNARQSTGGYLSDLAQQAQEKSADLAGRARRYSKPAPSSRRMVEQVKGSPGKAAGISISALGAIAVAGGAYLLFEPRRGRERRAYLMDKAGDGMRQAGKFARAAREYVSRSGEQASKLISFGPSPMAGEPVDDLTLERRIRGELAQSGNVSEVHVAASNGIVTLSGHCEPGKISQVLKKVEKMQGVKRVQNDLRAYDLSSNAPSAARIAPNPPAM